MTASDLATRRSAVLHRTGSWVASARSAGERHLYWVIPTLLGALVALHGITAWPLWIDEIFTLSAIDRSFGELLAFVSAAREDTALAAYYVLLRTWTELAGTSELALRLPSALAVAGAVGLTAVLGKMWRSQAVGAGAGLLLVMMPTLSIFHAHDARPYALVVMLACAATLALARAVEAPSRRRWWAYTLLAALMGLMHFVSLAILAGHAAYAWARGPAIGRRWLLPAALGVAPGLAVAFISRGQTAAWEWIAPIGLGDLFATPVQVVGAVALTWLLLGLAIVGWRAGDRAWRWLAVGWLAAPPLVLVLVSLLYQPALVPRYLVVVLPALALLSAAGAARARALPLVLLMAAVIVVEGQASERDRFRQRIDYRAAAELVARHVREGDAIMYSWGQYAVAMEYYMDPSVRPVNITQRRPAGQDVQLLPRMPAPAPEVLDLHDRVWFAHSDGSESAQPYLVLLGDYRLVLKEQFHTPGDPFAIALYER